MIKPVASISAAQRVTFKGLCQSRRFGLFTIMLGVELCLLLSVAGWLLSSAQPRTPLAAKPDLTLLTREIQGRLSGAILDPLIEVKPGVTIRSSNVRGFRYEGQIYYYYIEGVPGYDPLSRGLVRPDQVEIMLRDSSGPQTIVLYRVY
ncbi:hypothetical protein [Chloroflexus sp.]|uniref:hypothetical protein n=1 Tax=Chloroflexus sp. TaxID=1904827 RepID=UPI002613B7DC|nr:hypothetical protein [uncultured Chloroflexus sp.]